VIKYRTVSWGGSPIESVEIEKETEKCVWIKGSRMNKYSGYYIFHDSWMEAKAHLLARAERNLESARRSIQRAQDDLGNIKGLKESKQ
jgi:hypothetical protein